MKSLPVFIRTALVSVLGVSLLTLLGACGKSDETTGEDGEAVRVVMIGHAGPLTGPIAHLGKDNENGVRLAIEEANAAGLMIGGEKVSFEMISEDDDRRAEQPAHGRQDPVDAPAQFRANEGELPYGIRMRASAHIAGDVTP